jgi:hypothetical protein
MKLILEAMGGTRKQQSRDGAAGIGAEFDHRIVDARHHRILHAIDADRVGIDDRLAAIELFEQREIIRIAEPFIAGNGHQGDTVSFERVLLTLRAAEGNVAWHLLAALLKAPPHKSDGGIAPLEIDAREEIARHRAGVAGLCAPE